MFENLNANPFSSPILPLLSADQDCYASSQRQDFLREHEICQNAEHGKEVFARWQDFCV